RLDDLRSMLAEPVTVLGAVTDDATLTIGGEVTVPVTGLAAAFHGGDAWRPPFADRRPSASPAPGPTAIAPRRRRCIAREPSRPYCWWRSWQRSLRCSTTPTSRWWPGASATATRSVPAACWPSTSSRATAAIWATQSASSWHPDGPYWG